MRAQFLYRPGVVRAIARAGGVLLAAVLLAEWPWPLHNPLHHHWPAADFPAFHALYGFVSCLGLIAAARGLGKLIKRPENYYPENHHPENHDGE